MARLADEITECRTCDRLVTWREQVARDKRASFREQDYWGRAVSGFGDPSARILLLGLAPAAHGANRTGRVFTGDRSGDFLFAALHRVGLANQPMSVSADDGLTLRDVWVTAAVKCAPPDNKPLPAERDACRPFLRRELSLLDGLRVVVCLGAFAFDAACVEWGVRPRPKFRHLEEVPAMSRPATAPPGSPAPVLLCSFHPSQQNTFTGRLTPAMLDAVFVRAVALSENHAL
jgi:uracil-DNA glycosylase family 4